MQPEFFQDLSVKERLHKLRKAYGRWLALALAARIALVLAVTAGAALLLTPWAQDALRITLLGAAAVGGGYLIFRLRGTAKPLRSQEHFARYLQEAIEGARQDFETALALEGTAFQDPATAAFAHGHRRNAAARLAAVPLPVIRKPRNKKIDWAAAALWGGVAVFALAAPDRFAEARHAWLRWDTPPSAETLTGAKATTLVAEFQFSIAPPRYTGLDPEVITGNGELIRAYKGSSVAVTVRVQSAAEELRLNLPGGAVVPLKGAEGSAGEFVVTENGRFSLSIMRDGEWYEDATERTIELIPDQVPGVRVLAPGDGVTMNSESSLSLQYEASDDFGFTKAALVIDAGGREQRFALPVSAEVTRYLASKTFYLRDWNLPEGEAVQYYVEVYDNDTISGPKRGTSKPQTLETYSPRKAHQALLDRLEQLVDVVAHALADQIELPEVFGRREAGPKLDGLSARLGAASAEALALAAAFQADPLADAASTATLEGIARRTGAYRREVGAYAAAVSNGAGAPQYQGFRARGIETMERITIDLAGLLRENRMQDMLLTAADLERARGELKQMLADYKENPAPAKLEALRAKMEQIKKLMAELSRQRAAMAEALPEEFYNADAFQKAWDEHPAGQLENIEKMLEGNDPERALAEIENFERSLGDMLANLERAGQTASQQANAGDYQKLSQALQEVSELEAGQRKLAEQVKQAEKKNQQAQSQQAADMKQKLTAEVAKLKREAVKVREKSAMSTLWQRGFGYYAPQTVEEIDRVAKAVGSGDWGGARQQLQRAESYLRSMQMQAEMEAEARVGGDLTEELRDETRKTADHAQEIRRLLDNPGRQSAEGQGGGEMQQLEQAQAKLQERLQKLQEKLDPKDGQGPPMKQESRQALEGGEKAMENARTKMRGNQQADASMKAEEAADQLAQAKQQMEQMKQDMERMASGSPSGKQEGQGRGRMGASEKVEIPHAGEQKADRRDEVMKGMREGLPKAYEDLNKKYYDRLVK